MVSLSCLALIRAKLRRASTVILRTVKLVSCPAAALRILCLYPPPPPPPPPPEWTESPQGEGCLSAYSSALGRAAVRHFLDVECDAGKPLALCGDLNIAPEREMPMTRRDGKIATCFIQTGVGRLRLCVTEAELIRFASSTPEANCVIGGIIVNWPSPKTRGCVLSTFLSSSRLLSRARTLPQPARRAKGRGAWLHRLLPHLGPPQSDESGKTEQRPVVFGKKT